MWVVYYGDHYLIGEIGDRICTARRTLQNVKFIEYRDFHMNLSIVMYRLHEYNICNTKKRKYATRLLGIPVAISISKNKN